MVYGREKEGIFKLKSTMWKSWGFGYGNYKKKDRVWEGEMRLTEQE